MDWSGALGTRFSVGAAMYLGFRADGAWDTGAVCSSTAVGGGRILSVREKPDVCGLLRGLDGLVGCVRQSEPRYAFGGAYCTVAVVLFVKFYEEPTLRKMFGADYDEYCRTCRGGFRERMHGADEPLSNPAGKRK